MLSALVAAAVAAPQSSTVVQAVAPPPIIEVLPPAPPVPPIVRTPNESLPAELTAVIPMRVRVMAGGRQLFSDTLRVSRIGGANYQESRSEAPPVVCAYGSTDRYSLSVNIYLRDNVATGSKVNVAVTWQRPVAQSNCSEDGTRQVQLTQTVPLAPGQTVTIQGDAGLSVTLSR